MVKEDEKSVSLNQILERQKQKKNCILTDLYMKDKETYLMKWMLLNIGRVTLVVCHFH